MTLWGQPLDPHAAWLTERGMRTLALRMERHNANGLAVARWAEARDGIAAVHYPGLPSHADHALAAEVLDGFGGMVGLEIKGGARAAERFLKKLKLVTHAPSLAGVESLISEPRLTSHTHLTEDQRMKLGIPDGFVRLSCGIEDAGDIIADLDQALG
jgi:cystathionine beta-lyase/cystathionine gamma-synthase